MSILEEITEKKAAGKKQLAVLIDPDKFTDEVAERFISSVAKAKPDYIFVGGSLTASSTDEAIRRIKENTDIKVVLFPGNSTQLSDKADAMLMLSLISGRNADFLIGQHVVAAPFIKKSGIETISTGYMLIESGTTTSVEYISNTRPIPREKNDIAVATAIAGELLGNKAIYLEGGSGAKMPVPAPMIKAVRRSISLPIIVGGGLRSEDDIKNALEAGADIVVIGTSLEADPEKMIKFAEIVRNF